MTPDQAPPRPHRISPDVRRATALILAQDFAKWCQEDCTDEHVSCVERALGYGSRDGYHIARELERLTYCDADMELAEAMEAASSIGWNEEAKAVKAWVAANAIATPDWMGRTVTIPRGQGVVVGSDPERAVLHVRPPEHGENAYWLIPVEEVSLVEGEVIR